MKKQTDVLSLLMDVRHISLFVMVQDSGQCECFENGKKISVKKYKKLFKKCGSEDFSYWKLNTDAERKNIL